MKVFLSWSGDLSRNVATVFSNWLPGVIQECADPFISTDTSKGDPWFETITTNLKENQLGVVFITRDNLESSWLNFEAGALLNKFEKSGVRPLLIDFKKGDYKGPMSNLQLTEIDDKNDMKLLMKSINERCSKPLNEVLLQKTFGNSWEELRDGVHEALRRAELPKGKPSLRSQNDKIDEILNLVRGIASEPRSEKNSNNAAMVVPPSERRKEQHLRGFAEKYGSLVALHRAAGTIGDITNFKEDNAGNLEGLKVVTRAGDLETWNAGEFEIVTF